MRAEDDDGGSDTKTFVDAFNRPATAGNSLVGRWTWRNKLLPATVCPCLSSVPRERSWNGPSEIVVLLEQLPIVLTGVRVRVWRCGLR